MITICIPTYNRSEMVIESFKDVIEMEIISEVVIVDDNSNCDIFNDLKRRINIFKNKKNGHKIILYQNNENKKAFHNKLECVKKSSNDWIVLLDSDNILTTDYINSIPKNLDENTFYIPSRAICSSDMLDYSKFSNRIIDINTYKDLALSNDPKVECMLNTGNYFFNKKTYIESIDKEEKLLDCYAIDPFYQIFLGFKNIKDFRLNVVSDMRYYHRLHDNLNNECGSYYTLNSNNSSIFLKLLKEIIKTL